FQAEDGIRRLPVTGVQTCALPILKDLAGHLTNAKQVSGKLSKGLVDLHKGAGSLKDGSRKVADGTGALADRVNAVDTEVGPFLRSEERRAGGGRSAHSRPRRRRQE